MRAEWKEGKYGTYDLNLELLFCSIWWSTDRARKYDVQVGPHRLKRDFPTVDEAKRAAERFALKALTRALALLPDGPNGGSDG